MKHRAFFVLIVVLILISGLAAYEIFFNPANITGIEAAKGAAAFIDGMRLPDGNYVLSKSCNEQNCINDLSATTTDATPPSNAWAALAFAGLHRATGDAKYLDKARLEADKMLETCRSGSSHESDCDWSLSQLKEVYTETKDEKYMQFITERAAALHNNTPPLVNKNSMVLSLEARSYAAAGNAKWFAEAIGMAEKAAARDVVISENPPLRANDCWIILAKMDGFEAFGTKTLKDDATAFFNERDAAVLSGFGVLGQMHACIEALGKLDPNSPKLELLDLALIKKAFDNNKYESDNSFVSLPCNINATGGVFCLAFNAKSVTDNAYSAFLLSTTAPTKKFALSARKPSFGNVELKPSEPATIPTDELNWTHIDRLGVLNIFWISDSEFDGFVVVYYTDINAPLSNPVILDVDGTRYEPAHIETGDEMQRRSEVQYEFEIPRKANASTYHVVLYSGSTLVASQTVNDIAAAK